MNTTVHRPTDRTRPARRLSWRVVDIVVAAVLAAVCAVVFWAWSNLLYPAVAAAAVAYPPATGLITGGWLVAGVLGGLVIRKPGAALFVELLAAVLQGLLGTHFGWTVVLSGLIQGLGAELVLAAWRYRRFDVLVAVLAGAVSGLYPGRSARDEAARDRGARIGVRPGVREGGAPLPVPRDGGPALAHRRRAQTSEPLVAFGLFSSS